MVHRFKSPNRNPENHSNYPPPLLWVPEVNFPGVYVFVRRTWNTKECFTIQILWLVVCWDQSFRSVFIVLKACRKNKELEFPLDLYVDVVCNDLFKPTVNMSFWNWVYTSVTCNRHRAVRGGTQVMVFVISWEDFLGISAWGCPKIGIGLADLPRWDFCRKKLEGYPPATYASEIIKSVHFYEGTPNETFTDSTVSGPGILSEYTDITIELLYWFLWVWFPPRKMDVFVLGRLCCGLLLLNKPVANITLSRLENISQMAGKKLAFSRSWSIQTLPPCKHQQEWQTGRTSPWEPNGNLNVGPEDMGCEKMVSWDVNSKLSEKKR